MLKVLRKGIVCLFLLFVLSQLPSFHILSVRSQPSSLLVFAEASSFVRLDDIDPSGWFYQAVLYNPTDSDIDVSGLRWWYNASVKLMDSSRNARCYDTRYFSFLPATYNPVDTTIWWEYAPGSISITVPAKEIILTWIEVPTNSKNDNGILATYYVQAYVDSQWLSSPLYVSHSGHDRIASTVFRADFNLTTDPNDEQQTHPNPEWLFNEDRSVIANLSTRVRIIPVTASRNTLGIDYATVNVTLPLGWSYVLGSEYNPYNETINAYIVDGKDRLKWDLDGNVLRYSTDQSMAQNYMEFNVTAPYVPGIHNFTVTSIITSLVELWTTIENQYICAVVKTPPNATFTYSPTTPLTSEDVTFNATDSYDLDGQIVNHLWDFGDGNTDTGDIASHSYLDNGTYTVTLAIIDNDGQKDTALDTVTVQNRPPIAQFTESATIVDTDVVISFNASDSYDPDGNIVNYFWDFDDGTNTTGIAVNHAYLENGSYTVKLTVTDDDGASTIATDVKTILNRAPVASFVIVPQQPIANETITFNASDSYDPDGNIVTYTWNFGDGNITTIPSPTIIHKYSGSGNFTVTLTTIDNDDFFNSSALTLTVHSVDIAIVNVTVSADEVYIGQTVSISLFVKNEGTTNATFNAILYANDTVIETRTVQDLQPNETRALYVDWSTSSLTESGTYVLRAEIGEAQGETDVADNINETINIKVDTSSFNIWDRLNSYTMPISIGVILLFSAVAGAILIKRNKHDATPKTLPPKKLGIFDTLASEVIPDAYSVMIVGHAGSGKSMLCQQLVNTYLKQGKPCIYVSYDCFPDEIRKNMKSLGLDTSKYEQNETFLFVDCYSSIAGVTSQEKYNVEKPFELSELGIAMSIALKDSRQKPNRIFLDSTVPLLTRLDAAKVVEFLQDRIAKIKGENGVFFFTIGKGTVEHGLTRRLEEIVDCIIELDVHEKKDETDRRMRVKKLRGRRFHHEWVSFKIEKKLHDF